MELQGNAYQIDNKDTLEIIQNEALSIQDNVNNIKDLEFNKLTEMDNDELVRLVKNRFLLVRNLREIGNFSLKDRNSIIEKLQIVALFIIIETNILTEMGAYLKVGITSKLLCDIKQRYSQDKIITSLIETIKDLIQERLTSGVISGKLSQSGTIHILSSIYNIRKDSEIDNKDTVSDQDIFNQLLSFSSSSNLLE